MGLILPVIMCGGSGTRMWPLSRESYPKQFLPLISEDSSFIEGLRMMSRPDIFDAPIAISNKDYRFLVGEQMQAAGIKGEIVLEPMRRDSGPAVAIAAELAFRRSPDTIVAMLAADHSILDREGFVQLCQRAAETASKGYIVTLGVKPDHAATGYGYIRPGARLDQHAFAVAGFTEKPDLERAQKFVEAGYLWNSGNFFFRADVMRNEIEMFEPAIAEAARAALDNAREDLDFLVLDEASFALAPQKSIDYAVMERTQKGSCDAS